MKKGIILINAFSTVGEHQAKRLHEEFKNLGWEVPVVRNESGQIPSDIDFCIFLDKDIYLAKTLEKQGVKLFNGSASIEVCDDKMLTYIALDGVVDQPLTIPSSFCYTAGASVKDVEVDYIVSELGLPLVLKINKHSRGEGVFLIRNKEELKNKILQLRTIPHLYQKFISFASGSDTRVIVIGGISVACMKRVNEKDFRSNIEIGGCGVNSELSEEIAKTAVKVSKVLNLDYCGIDFLTDEEGLNYVCEVNSNAFFKGIESVSGVNVALLYAKYVVDFFEFQK